MEKDRQSRRWIVVINNAFFDDDDKPEIDINNTELPLKLDYYNLSHQKRDDNKHLFDFKYVVHENTVVERPYFKNLDALHEYYKNLDDIKYAVYNYEQGNEKQTKHIQSFVIFKFGKRFETMKGYFPTAYLKRPDGNNAENRNYCMKSETQIAGPFEVGVFAEERQRTDYDNFFAFLEQKASNKTLRQHFPMLFAKHFPQIKKMRQDILTEEYKHKFRNVRVIYIWGETGTGKTRLIMETFDYDNVYRVTEYDQRAFDGYTAQPVLLLDEFRSSFKISQMLNYLDGYPLKLPCRFEDCQACYTTVFIISNISLYEQYINIQKEEPTTWRAFLRRIHGVYRFDSPKDKEKLLAVLQDVDTTDEPYDPQIVAEIRRAAEIELLPITDNNLPW